MGETLSSSQTTNPSSPYWVLSMVSLHWLLPGCSGEHCSCRRIPMTSSFDLQISTVMPMDCRDFRFLPRFPTRPDYLQSHAAGQPPNNSLRSSSSNSIRHDSKKATVSPAKRLAKRNARLAKAVLAEERRPQCRRRLYTVGMSCYHTD